MSKTKSISRELLHFTDKLTPDVCSVIAEYLDESLNNNLLKEIKVWSEIIQPSNYIKALIQQGTMCWLCHQMLHKHYDQDSLRKMNKHSYCNISNAIKQQKKCTDKFTDSGELVWSGIQALAGFVELFSDDPSVKQYVDLKDFSKTMTQHKNILVEPCNQLANYLVNRYF